MLINSYIITQSFENLIHGLAYRFYWLVFRIFLHCKTYQIICSQGLGELAIFLTFGPLLTLGAYYAISSSTIELFSQGFYNAIYFGIPFGLLTTNILFINQFPDTSSDAKTGKNHLVVTFGKKIQDGDI